MKAGAPWKGGVWMKFRVVAELPPQVQAALGMPVAIEFEAASLGEAVQMMADFDAELAGEWRLESQLPDFGWTPVTTGEA
jgi:hypothetical protein